MSNKWMYLLLSVMWFVVGAFHACTHRTVWTIVLSAIGGVVFLVLAFCQGWFEKKGEAGRNGIRIIEKAALVTVIVSVTLIVILSLI